MTPWFIQLGPLMIPTGAREELQMTAHNLSRADYTNVMWADRDLAVKRRKSRSKSWPPTIYNKALKGYVLKVEETNVTTLPTKGRKNDTRREISGNR